MPILGICLGLQLLFESTTELGGADGPRPARRAGRRARGRGPQGPAHRLVAGALGARVAPHRGDRLARRPSTSSTPSRRGRAGEDLLGTAEYGARFACAAERDNVFGVQFHPEKSSAAGLRLLSNFAGICAKSPAAGVILYPAIDIRGGQAVRLLQGDYERETTYDADPVDAAKRWADEGAEFLHVVDLDGAKAGEPQNLDAVRRIAAAVECPIQVGGGLRDADSVAAVLRGRRRAGGDRHRGAARPRVPRRDARRRTATRVVVSVDARGGKVSLSGWTETSDVERRRRGRRAQRARRRALPLHRDRGRRHDGGPGDRAAEPRSPPRPRPRCIASGGVGDLSHLEQLAARGAPNIAARSSAAPSTSASSPSPRRIAALT